MLANTFRVPATKSIFDVGKLNTAAYEPCQVFECFQFMEAHAANTPRIAVGQELLPGFGQRQL